MDVIVTRTIEALLLPPGGPLLLALAGIVLLFTRFHRAARVLLLTGILTLWVASLPVVSKPVLRALEVAPVAVDATAAGAIVVLGGERYAGAPEYGGDTVGSATLERIRYGAYLHRATGLPVLVTGGSPLGERRPEADLMQRALREEFGVTGVWVEAASRTTDENARFSAELLRKRGVSRVLLVTHAWHMRRSLLVFRAAGIDAVPAPTVFATDSHRPWFIEWLPGADALRDTRRALHEWLGIAWYRLRGYA